MQIIFHRQFKWTLVRILIPTWAATAPLQSCGLRKDSDVGENQSNNTQGNGLGLAQLTPSPQISSPTHNVSIPNVKPNGASLTSNSGDMALQIPDMNQVLSMIGPQNEDGFDAQIHDYLTANSPCGRDPSCSADNNVPPMIPPAAPNPPADPQRAGASGANPALLDKLSICIADTVSSDYAGCGKIKDKQGCDKNNELINKGIQRRCEWSQNTCVAWSVSECNKQIGATNGIVVENTDLPFDDNGNPLYNLRKKLAQEKYKIFDVFYHGHGPLQKDVAILLDGVFRSLQTVATETVNFRSFGCSLADQSLSPSWWQSVASSINELNGKRGFGTYGVGPSISKNGVLLTVTGNQLKSLASSATINYRYMGIDTSSTVAFRLRQIDERLKVDYKSETDGQSVPIYENISFHKCATDDGPPNILIDGFPEDKFVCYKGGSGKYPSDIGKISKCASKGGVVVQEICGSDGILRRTGPDGTILIESL